MVELYNTIADPSGITRGHNPYNAKVVRSFVERGKIHFSFSLGGVTRSLFFLRKGRRRKIESRSRTEIEYLPLNDVSLSLSLTILDTTLSNYYFFNISGLEMDESVLEAELHLYRKKTPPRNVHPLTLTSPYYMVKCLRDRESRSTVIRCFARLERSRTHPYIFRSMRR